MCVLNFIENIYTEPKRQGIKEPSGIINKSINVLYSKYIDYTLIFF